MITDNEINKVHRVNEDEATRVAEISRTAEYAKDLVNRKGVIYSGNIFLRHMRPGSVLELGPAEGIMTDILYPHFEDDYTVVDGADFFVEDLVKRYPKIKGYTALFEEFKPGRKYDNIVLGHVLEHVADPVEILSLA